MSSGIPVTRHCHGMSPRVDESMVAYRSSWPSNGARWDPSISLNDCPQRSRRSSIFEADSSALR